MDIKKDLGENLLGLVFSMVGDTRIELVTSSVSRKRSTSELITHGEKLYQ